MFRFRLKRKKIRLLYKENVLEILRYNGNDIPYKKIRRLLNKVEVCIRRHKYNSDPYFTSKGRRTFLKGEIVDYLKAGKYKEALGDFQEYIIDESYNYPSFSAFETKEEAIQTQEYNMEYVKKGIVCKEDRDNILEIIHLFRYYLKIN
jgi:hypothetical protein